jgi:hypothetical protein
MDVARVDRASGAKQDPESSCLRHSMALVYNGVVQLDSLVKAPYRAGHMSPIVLPTEQGV